jgi:hypothetical protein
MSETPDERTVSAEQIRAEHLADVRVGVQWAYLVGVLGFGTLAMLILIAILDVT